MQGFLSLLERSYLGAIVFVGVAWVLDVPQYFGFSLISVEWMGPMLSVGIAAAYLRHPYRPKAGVLELTLGLVAICSWSWMSLNYSDWIIDIFGYTPEKYLPGLIAILLLMNNTA